MNPNNYKKNSMESISRFLVYSIYKTIIHVSFDFMIEFEKQKSIISPDKNSRWHHNISRSYTDFLLISNSPDNVEEI